MGRETVKRVYHGRRAVAIENDRIRVTVLEGGGHIAEIFDKATGVNPLWTPPWRSIEPEAFDHATTPATAAGRRRAAALRHHGSQLVPRFLRRTIGGGGSRRSQRARRRLDRDLRDRPRRFVAGHAGDAPDRPTEGRAPDFTPRTGRAHSRNRREPHRRRPSRGMDATRHARPAVSGARRHGVSRVGDALEDLRERLRQRGLSPRRRRVRLADGPGRSAADTPTCAAHRRRRRPAPTPRT